MTQELTINQHTNFTLILADDPAAEAPDHSTEIKLLSPISSITALIDEKLMSAKLLIIRKPYGHVQGVPTQLQLKESIYLKF